MRPLSIFLVFVASFGIAVAFPQGNSEHPGFPNRNTTSIPQAPEDQKPVEISSPSSNTTQPDDGKDDKAYKEKLELEKKEKAQEQKEKAQEQKEKAQEQKEKAQEQKEKAQEQKEKAQEQKQKDLEQLQQAQDQLQQAQENNKKNQDTANKRDGRQQKPTSTNPNQPKGDPAVEALKKRVEDFAKNIDNDRNKEWLKKVRDAAGNKDLDDENTPEELYSELDRLAGENDYLKAELASARRGGSRPHYRRPSNVGPFRGRNDKGVTVGAPRPEDPFYTPPTNSELQDRGASISDYCSFSPGHRFPSGTRCLLKNGRLEWRHGDLALRDASGKALWGVSTKLTGDRLEYEGDGNLVIYGFDGKPIWNSKSQGTGEGRAF